MEESSKVFRAKILNRIKYLTNHGKHIEASALYKKYFES
tara:strand:- start:190 stop:306 length:117 start_codon:yes stop_codon:yes gene_type:complete